MTTVRRIFEMFGTEGASVYGVKTFLPKRKPSCSYNLCVYLDPA